MAAVVKMEFTTWERTTLASLLNSLKGPTGFVFMALKVLDKLALTDEEKEDVGWEAVGATGAKWTDAEREWEMEFAPDEWTFLEARVKDKDDWPVDAFTGDMLRKIVPEA